jgi:hypothetical protein
MIRLSTLADSVRNAMGLANEPRPVENQASRKNTLRIYLACAVLTLAIFSLDLNVPLGVAVPILYNLVLLIALRAPSRKFIVAIAIISSLFTIGPFFHKAPIEQMEKAIANRSLALFSFWVACYLGLQKRIIEERRANTLKEREKALEEVRVLRGFLPICASCKRIRDYEGSWTLLEKYISEHSEAAFSHGLCPDCTKRLFPDLFQKQESGGLLKPKDTKSED